MNYHTRNKKSGFTLVEMIVSLALFSVVATVSLGALIKIVSANKKAQTLHATITNLNFALETMSREMRVGAKYHCYDFADEIDTSVTFSAQNCSYGNFWEQIAFESSKEYQAGATTCHLIIAYRFVNAGVKTIEKAEQDSCGDTLPNDRFVPIVSLEDVTIDDIGFGVTSDAYKLFFIKISGHAGVREREKTDFTVQTAISARLP